jgi:CheY-like chemotaxis protein
MPGDRERCLAAGATEYMTKPVSLRKLAEMIAQLITRDDRAGVAMN